MFLTTKKLLERFQGNLKHTDQIDIAVAWTTSGTALQQYFLRPRVSRHGVNITHIAGQVVADAIADTHERFDVFGKLKYLCIPSGHWVGNQLLALG